MKNAQEVIPTTYIHTANTKSPSPRLRNRWSNLRKLNWQASLIMAEHPDVRLYVTKGWSMTNNRFNYGRFQISYNGGGLSSMDFNSAWQMLIGISIGLEIAESTERRKQWAAAQAEAAPKYKKACPKCGVIGHDLKTCQDFG